MVSALMPPLYDAPSRRPVPGQQLIKPVDGVIVDAGEHVGELGLWIDVVELRSHDQRGHDSGAVGAAFGAGEQRRLASQRKSAQRSSAALFVRQIFTSWRKRANASRRLSM